MNQVMKFKVRSRISKLAFKGGITAREAVSRADAAIEALRGPCLAAIDSTLAEIDARFGHSAADRNAEPLSDLYGLASQIIDAGIGLPNSGIDQAARALCELVDLSLVAESRSWVAIDVHIRALQLLRTHGTTLSPQRREAVIHGLGEVVVKQFGPAAAP